MKIRFKRPRIKKKQVIEVVLLLAVFILAWIWYVNYIVGEADYFVRLGYTDVNNINDNPSDYYAIKGRLNLKISETLAVENSSEDIRDGTRAFDGQEKDYFYVTLNFRFNQDADSVFQRVNTAESSFGPGYTIEYKTYLNNGASLDDIEESLLDKVFNQIHSGNVSDSISHTSAKIVLKDFILIRYNRRYVALVGNDLYELSYQNDLKKILTIPNNRRLDYITFDERAIVFN